MNSTGFDEPDSVCRTTGTDVPAGRAGAVATQLCSSGQRVRVTTPPKVTTILPSALKKPLPAIATCVPLPPELGEIDATTGAVPTWAGVVVVGVVVVEVAPA